MTATESLLLAQQATDNTSTKISLIILGLMLVALLLAVLTFWYWRHTDPRRQLRRPVPEPIAARSDSVNQPGPDVEAERVADSVVAVGGRTAVAPPVPDRPNFGASAEPAPHPRSTDELLADGDADEWLRLTGPEALRRKA